MTGRTFDIFLIVYYIFFAGLFVLASIVYSKLKKISVEISKKNFNKIEINFEIYKSPELFIMHFYPDLPLSALVKILPGTFVGLGILGTFIGFSDGISEMSLTGNVDDLFGKLDVFFAGLNTAFITSIIGVVLSVIFGIIYQFPLNKIKFHCANIYNVLTNDKSSNTNSEFDVYISSLKEITKTIFSAKEAIETLPVKFLDVGKNLEESIAPIKETFGTMQITLENYSKQAQSLQNASEQIQKTLTKFIENSEQATLKVNTTLKQTIIATKTIQDNNSKLNEQISESHKTIMKDYQEIDENISSILIEVNKNLKEYSKTIETTLVQTLEEYNKTAQKVTESFFGEKK